MPSLHFRGSHLAAATALAGLALSLGACSSTNSGGSTPTSTPPTSPPATSPATSSGAEPTTGSGAVAAIESNWATFFNAKTPLARRLALLQNGQVFASVIRTQLSGSFASLATSKVTHVSLTGTSQAAVTYTILVGGKPALSNQSGTSVYQDGVWKVGDSSLCALLKLENGGKSKGLPAACAG